MTIELTITYPPLPAQKGEEIKGDLQSQDILGDFGPGQSLWSHLFGGKKPDMTRATFIEPDWFEPSFDGTTSPAPLTAEGRNHLTTAVTAICNAADRPVTVHCHQPGEKPRAEIEFPSADFATFLSQEGLPTNTLIILR